jgi:hypothetical protein
MKAAKPFLKSFVCAGLLFVLFEAVFFEPSAPDAAYRLGYVFGFNCLIPALATGTWGFFSKKQWSWGRFAITAFAFQVVFTFIMSSVKVQ